MSFWNHGQWSRVDCPMCLHMGMEILTERSRKPCVTMWAAAMTLSLYVRSLLLDTMGVFGEETLHGGCYTIRHKEQRRLRRVVSATQ